MGEAERRKGGAIGREQGEGEETARRREGRATVQPA